MREISQNRNFVTHRQERVWDFVYTYNTILWYLGGFMRRFKSLLSIFMCVALMLPMAIFPAQAQSQYIKELGAYIKNAESLMYSGGTAISRRKLKAVCDEAYVLYDSESQYIDKVTAMSEKLAAAIADFEASRPHDNPYRLARAYGFATKHARHQSPSSDP